MTDDRSLHLKQQLLDEIWEEIGSLEGKELDEYLAGIGLGSDSLLENYAEALNAACVASKRARFEKARRELRHKSDADFGKITVAPSADGNGAFGAGFGFDNVADGV